MGTLTGSLALVAVPGDSARQSVYGPCSGASSTYVERIRTYLVCWLDRVPPWSLIVGLPSPLGRLLRDVCVPASLAPYAPHLGAYRRLIADGTLVALLSRINPPLGLYFPQLSFWWTILSRPVFVSTSFALVHCVNGEKERTASEATTNSQ